MRPIRFTAVMSAALLLNLGAAWAIPPDIGTLEFPGNDGVLFACNGFDAREAYDAVVHFKVFFDTQGVPIRVQERVIIDGIIYNSTDADKFLTEGATHYTITTDLVSGPIIFTGLFFHVNVPGFGSIFMDVGRVVFDENFNLVFEAGQHQFWNAEIAALCAALE